MQKTYFIQTFGCAQNVADSERIAQAYENRGMVKAESMERACHIIINTCMIREKAENRVYGVIHNLSEKRKKTGLPEKIIVTGCMVGMAMRDATGNFLKLIRERLPLVDEFLPIEEVGFDHSPLRGDLTHALVPISNGCNNFCTFCVVPFTRGREISRPYVDVLHECALLAKQGYKKITLLGMNVNSYGADLVVGQDNIQVLRDIEKKYFESSLNSHSGKPKARPESPADSGVANAPQNDKKLKGYTLPNGNIVQPIFVKHLNRLRIPTLFPYLLEDISKISDIEEIDFLSSNPWDFSDELIDVIARNPNITRSIHLPVQSGSNSLLRRMNRWYTREDYLALVEKLKRKIPAQGGSASGGKNLKLSTDFIVGFCGETKEEFQETVDLAKDVSFYKAYISMYSDRPMTAAHKVFTDSIPYEEKKRRWLILEDMINKKYHREHAN